MLGSSGICIILVWNVLVFGVNREKFIVWLEGLVFLCWVKVRRVVDLISCATLHLM